MKPGRIAVKLKLTHEKYKKLQQLSRAFKVTDRMAAEECIEAAYELYTTSLANAAAKHLQGQNDGKAEDVEEQG